MRAKLRQRRKIRKIHPAIPRRRQRILQQLAPNLRLLQGARQSIPSKRRRKSCRHEKIRSIMDWRNNENLCGMVEKRRAMDQTRGRFEDEYDD